MTTHQPKDLETREQMPKAAEGTSARPAGALPAVQSDVRAAVITTHAGTLAEHGQQPAVTLSDEQREKMKQYTVEVLRPSGDAAVDQRKSEEAAQMQIDILAELQQKKSQKSGKAEDVVGASVEESDVDAVAEEIREGMEDVDNIILRNEQGEPVGFAITEVKPLTGKGFPEGSATLFVWLIGVKKELRGQGLARLINEKILESATEQAQKNGLTIISVSMEGSRDVESTFAKHWGARGVYARHASGNLVEVPYMSNPAAEGEIAEDPLDPSSKWLIGMLDGRTTLTPEQFLAHTRAVYEGYAEGKESKIKATLTGVQMMTRAAVESVLKGAPAQQLELVDIGEQQRIRAGQAGEQRVIEPGSYDEFLAKEDPFTHKRFQATRKRILGNPEHEK